MNLNDQIDALGAGVDQLIHAVHRAEHAARTAEAAAPAAAGASEAAPEPAGIAAETAGGAQAAAVTSAGTAEPAAPTAADAPDADAAPPAADKSTLSVARPSQNEITLTVNGQSITLHPEQLGQLIEELAHARASMAPEPPTSLPPGWRFVATRNPMMAVQKQSNGDRLLVARHTGYGWVPFTLAPDAVIQMYMMLTQR